MHFIPILHPRKVWFAMRVFDFGEDVNVDLMVDDDDLVNNDDENSHQYRNTQHQQKKERKKE